MRHVALHERAPALRQGCGNIDVRGPGLDAPERMGLLETAKAGNTTEQAWTFCDADNAAAARFDRDAFSGELGLAPCPAAAQPCRLFGVSRVLALPASRTEPSPAFALAGRNTGEVCVIGPSFD